VVLVLGPEVLSVLRALKEANQLDTVISEAVAKLAESPAVFTPIGPIEAPQEQNNSELLDDEALQVAEEADDVLGKGDDRPEGEELETVSDLQPEASAPKVITE
jgi:hypothetical protein